MALGPHTVTVLPPVDTVPMPLWSTRTRTQSWALESVLLALRHDGEAVAWRYDARGDEVVVFEPGADERRTELTVDDPLLARGGAVEVSRRALPDPGGGRTQRHGGAGGASTTWMDRRKRSLVYVA